MNKTIKPKDKAYNTKLLLTLISSHLSGRDCCNGREYTLTLSSKYPSGYSFDTEVYVFPDRYHRKESDKDSVIVHVLKNHISEICDEDLNILLELVIPGTYVYRLSIDGRRRKWVLSK